MLEFLPLKLNDIPPLKPWFETNPDRLCDGTVGGEFLWRDYYNIRYAKAGEALCQMAYYPEKGYTAFSFPLGGNTAQALNELYAYAKAMQLPLIFCPVSEADTQKLLKQWPSAAVEPQRQWYDYLYSAQELRELAGRRFGGQRNHINRFQKENPDWHFEKIGPENLERVIAFYKDFLKASGKEFAAAAEESRKTLEVLENWNVYGFVGGVVFVQQQIVAFALGEIVQDTLYVHIEKADRAWHGSYPMIVQQMARAYTGEAEGVLWINREDDVGDDGLRTVKLSYHPATLLEKNTVTVQE